MRCGHCCVLFIIVIPASLIGNENTTGVRFSKALYFLVERRAKVMQIALFVGYYYYWLLAIVYWLLGVECCLLAVVYWLLAIGHWLLAVVYWLLAPPRGF
jgi:hypothetical protein